MQSATGRKMITAAVASLALLQAQAASAQECIAPQDLTDAAIYAVPVIANGFRASCSAQLSPNGFFATQGQAFVAPYEAMQAERWPGAMRAVMAFATSGKDQLDDASMREMVQDLPPEALRPFVDAILAQKLGESIKPADCGKIERAMELLSPLPPENLGGLLTFVMDVTGNRQPAVCDVDG